MPSKIYRGVEVYIYFPAYFAYFEEMKAGLLTSILLGGEFTASRSVYFLLGIH
jgi:hypothetical protein